jgi:hypothetical protein
MVIEVMRLIRIKYTRFLVYLADGDLVDGVEKSRKSPNRCSIE